MDISDLIEQIKSELLNQSFEKAKELANQIDDPAERFNSMGVISFYEKNYTEAVEWFARALEINPHNPDYLFNYGKALFEMGHYTESWRYLTRIENKSWEAFDLMGDIQLRLSNPAMALFYYKKAYDVSHLEEIKVKYMTLRFLSRRPKKLVFFLKEEIEEVSRNIAEALSHIFEIRVVSNARAEDALIFYRWADVVWIECFRDETVNLINNLSKVGKKLVCVIRSLTDLSQFAEKVNWRRVDKIILSSEEHLAVLSKNYPSLFNETQSKIIVVHYGLDLNKFKFRASERGSKVALIINTSEGELLDWNEILRYLLSVDEKYVFYIVKTGILVNEPETYKEQRFDKDEKVNSRVEIVKQIDAKNLDQFLMDKSFVISNQYDNFFVLAAMAKGIKPVIYKTPNTEMHFPEDCLFITISEISKIFSESYDSEKYRRFIEDEYSLENTINCVVKIIDELSSSLINNVSDIPKKISENIELDASEELCERNLRSPAEMLIYLQKIADVKSSEIGFFTTGRIGDNIYMYLLSEAIREHYKPEKLKFVVPRKLAGVAQLWFIDEVIAVEEKILEEICFSQIGHIYGLYKPSLGRLNCAHPGTIEKLSGIDDLNFLKLVKYQLGLNKNAELRLPKLPLPDEIFLKLRNRYPDELLKNSVIVSLESKAVRVEESVKKSLLRIIVKYSLSLNRYVMFNEEKWYRIACETFSQMSNMFFLLEVENLVELFAILHIVGRAFTIRSGLSDLIAISGARVFVFYPKAFSNAYGISVPYIKHFSLEELKALNKHIFETDEFYDETFAKQLTELLL